jgi:hypothetical protein
MDLSMILSPAVEEDEPAPPAPPEPNRKWSSDELQCAVAILQDFQQPGAGSPAAARGVARGRGGPHAVGHEQDHMYAPQDAAPVAISRSQDGSRATAPGHESAQGRNKRKAQAQQQQSSSASSAVWGDDPLSKLSLLVEADAIIKRRRPKAPPSPSDDKPEYLRSGVWSRAEEKYAVALLSYFLEGLLDLPEGMTLRKFLAEKLCCNRRRVSMKLGTESLAGHKIPRKAGASVFAIADPPPSDEQRQEVERVLAELREASFSTGFQGSGRRRQHDEDASEGFTERKMSNGYEDEVDDAPARRQKTATKRKWTRKEAKPKRGKPTIIRTGFETPEEEEFVTSMFEFFMAGALDLPEGTKLVSYLCQQLGCSPKQLSMKLAPKRMGERKFPDNVGAITYKRQDAGDASSEESDEEDFSEELFEVESRITELRLAHEEAHKSVPPPLATPVKRERKFSTASASSTGTASVASTPSASPVRSFRRSGPWSHDEETYAAALIDCFFKGVLDIAEGTTLRSFLSTRLCCNPMRVSKKLASEAIAEIPIPKKLGSSTYVQRAGVTSLEQNAAEESLRSLQDVYMHSSTAKRGGVLGSKRPRQSRVPRRLLAAADTDSDDTGSANSASPSSRERSPEKLQKTDKTHSPAQEARRQRFHVPHTGPELHVVVPAALKEQLA